MTGWTWLAAGFVSMMTVASGDVTSQRDPAAARGPVRIAMASASRSDAVERMPTVTANAAVGPSVAMRINAALRREDKRATVAAKGCRTMAMEASGKQDDEAWTRTVEITMAGPRYLSIEASDSYYCGGPYPNDDLISAFVYDLTTGRPVDWVALFPRGASATLQTAPNGANLGLVTWPELVRRSKAQAVGDCRDALKGTPIDYTVWLDARSGELVAVPGNFPHVIQSCAEEVRLNIADLRRLGFSPALTNALDAANRLQQPTKRGH